MLLLKCAPINTLHPTPLSEQVLGLPLDMNTQKIGERLSERAKRWNDTQPKLREKP